MANGYVRIKELNEELIMECLVNSLMVLFQMGFKHHILATSSKLGRGAAAQECAAAIAFTCV